MGKICCKGDNQYLGMYKSLMQRLVDMGNEVYQDFTNVHTLLFIFVFYDGNTECDKCKSSLSEMYTWFEKKGLLDNKNNMVKIIVEPEPEKNKIYTDFGFTKKPMHIFCDSQGRILDIFTGLPDVKWLNKHIRPLIEMNMGIGSLLIGRSSSRRSNGNKQ